MELYATYGDDMILDGVTADEPSEKNYIRITQNTKQIFGKGENFLQHFFPDQWGNEEAQQINDAWSAP